MRQLRKHWYSPIFLEHWLDPLQMKNCSHFGWFCETHPVIEANLCLEFSYWLPKISICKPPTSLNLLSTVKMIDTMLENVQLSPNCTLALVLPDRQGFVFPRISCPSLFLASHAGFFFFTTYWAVYKADSEQSPPPLLLDLKRRWIWILEEWVD